MLGAGNDRFGARSFEAAAEAYRACLAAEPSMPQAWQNLGVALSALGEPARSVPALRRALRLRPDYALALENLGEAARLADRPEVEEAAARHALACVPDDADAWLRLARLQTRRRARGEAVASIDRALRLAPGVPVMMLQAADGLGQAGLYPEAIELCRRAVSAEGGPEARFLLARMLERVGEDAEALEILDRLHQEIPDNGIVAHCRDALRGRPSAERAPGDYVRRLFDASAADFDEHLVGRLGYRAHEVVAEVARRRMRGPGAILDAGCGTGLVGAALAGDGHRITGVDLSPEMLVRARNRHVYEALVVADLIEFLESRPEGAYDAVLSADVLCYFGNLRPVFAAAARALAPGGFMAFTVEQRLEDGWGLMDSGRYAHSAAHLREAARGVLRLAALGTEVLRREAGRPVRGLLCVLARP
jgi:predicted TPR repeat methyltransferase